VVRRNDPSPLAFYDECWASVLRANPRHVVLNSWNEFAEQTGMEPADTSNLPAGCDAWVDAAGKPSPTVYWQRTVDGLAQWRAMP
jgi:hypothetical protein